jgi:hypothetical protein
MVGFIMNDLCKVCVNNCKDDYKKIKDNGSYCYDWIPVDEWVRKIEQENLYWCVN